MSLLVVEPKDLQVGDGFFFHSNTPHGQLIQLITGGYHNHEGRWTGKGIAHAIASGYKEQGLEEAIEESDIYVDVVRWAGMHDDMYGTALGTKEYPFEPVFERIQYHLSRGESYEFESLLTLFGLCELRRITNPDIYLRLIEDKMMQKVVLEPLENNVAIKLIGEVAGRGKDLVICSEIDYTDFEEAGEKYRPVILPDSMHNAYTNATINESELLKKYAEIKKAETGINANFVTPHDHWMSPNWCIHLGRLKFKHLKIDY